MSYRNQICTIVALSLVLLAGLAHADSIELISRVSPGLESASASGASTTYSVDFMQPRQRPPAGNRISSDGRYTAFVSSAGNLVPGQTETSGTWDIFVHDRIAGTTILVSRSTLGGGRTANGGSSDPVISADGRYIAFLSYATDLAPGQVDTNSGTDVFLFDRQTETMTLVSRAAGTTATTAGEPSDLPVLSADGSWITFTSTATDLVAGVGSSELRQVYLFDRSAGTSRLVSHAAGGPATPGNGECLDPVLSSDGRYVAYASTATDLVAGMIDEGSLTDVFLYDRVAATTALVSRTSDSAITAAYGAEPVISADGSHVAFGSSGQIVLYRRSDGLLTLVSHAAGNDQQEGDGFSSAAAISDDGSYVAFASSSDDLTVPGGPASIYPEVYLFERSTGAITLLGPPSEFGSEFPTISADGGEVVFFTFDGTFLYSRDSGSLTLVSRSLQSPSENAGASGHFLSADGNFVAFSSFASSLVEADWNEVEDIFLFSRATGTNTLVSRADPNNPSLTSSGGGVQASISNDGNHVAFLSTARNLGPGQAEDDTDVDVFVWSRLTGLITRLSQAQESQPQEVIASAKISGDGEWVLFNAPVGDATPAFYDRALFLSRRTTGETLLVTHQVNAPTTFAEGSVEDVGTISGDGRFVAYRGSYTNVVAGQSGGAAYQVFLYDRVTDTTSLASHAAGSATTGGNGVASGLASISADGRFVVFASEATNLVTGQNDTNFEYDIFLYDRITGAVSLVSRRSGFAATAAADDGSSTPKISADGRWITFVSEATDLAAGQVDTDDSQDLFLHDRVTGTTVLITHAPGAATTAVHGGGIDPSISADGRFVAFANGANNLTPGSSSSCPMFTSCTDIYLYDRITGENVMVSHSAASLTASGGRLASDARITANGRYVTFASDSEDHVPGLTDSELSRDLFLYDRTTGAIEILSRRDEDPTVATGGAFYATPNADGSRIVLETPVPHQDGDFNGTLDLYLYSKDLAGADLFTLPPCRLFDTRRPEDGPVLVSGNPVLLTIDGGCGIPSTAQSLVINVTVFEPAGRGNLSLYPGDGSGVGTSTINFQPGVNKANNAIVRLSLDGSGSIGVRPLVTGSGTVHVIIDVVGYFE